MDARSLIALAAVSLAFAVAAQAADAAPARCTITGTGGNDVLHGTPGPDVICGGAGNDRIYGGPGNDVLRGGPGDDRIDGGHGDDRLSGGSGTNTLDAEPGIVGDGPPCGPNAPVDCRFDLTIGPLNNPSNATYGRGSASTGTTQYSGNDGFSYPGLSGHPLSFAWETQGDGSVVRSRVAIDKVDSSLVGRSPDRGSPVLDVTVTTSAWQRPGRHWVSRSNGAPGTPQGPLYIDVESHQPLVPVGAPVEYNVHIFGWVHLAEDRRG